MEGKRLIISMESEHWRAGAAGSNRSTGKGVFSILQKWCESSDSWEGAASNSFGCENSWSWSISSPKIGRTKNSPVCARKASCVTIKGKS